jgi:hypothetical protein
MKHYLSLLFVFVLLFTTSCDKNNEGDKAAIKAVIEEATNAYKARDFDRMAAVWLQDESIIRLNSGNHNYSFSKGWKAIGSAYHDLFKDNPDAIVTEYEKVNFKIEIYKNSAWVTHDELIKDSEHEYQYHQIGVHLLVKEKGEWKIIYLSYVDSSSYDEDDVQESDTDKI